jgi:predicted RNA-binding Zn-ribbon protein involved in translation (DUF1610 family)
MNCWACNEVISRDMAFCPGCGKSLKGSKRSSDVAAKPAIRRNEAAVAVFEQLQASIDSRQAMAWAVCAGAGLLAFALYSWVSEPWFMVAGVVAVVALAWRICISNLSSSDYYALPGVSEADHACIFCGGKGIWRSTPYKTHTTLCKCSKCKEKLFTE